MSPSQVIRVLPGDPDVYSDTDAGLESSKEFKFPGELEQEWSPQASTFLMVIISAAWLKYSIVLIYIPYLHSFLKVIEYIFIWKI